MLILEVENFKNITKNTYEFKEGLNALFGQSGNGKTTILESIKWCLFSSKKDVFPNTFTDDERKKKGIVKVKLKFQSCYSLRKETKETIEIERSKLPDTVKILYENKTYKDSDAQNLINKLFGNKKIWESTSYINQGELNYVLGKECPFQEKTEIIKNIITEEEINEDKVNEEIKKYKNLYIISLKELNITKTNYTEHKNKYEKELNDFVEKETSSSNLIEKNKEMKQKLKEIEKFLENKKEFEKEKNKKFIYLNEEDYTNYFKHSEYFKEWDKLDIESFPSLENKNNFTLEELYREKEKIKTFKENKKICESLGLEYSSKVTNEHLLSSNRYSFLLKFKQTLTKLSKYEKDMKKICDMFGTEENIEKINSTINIKQLTCPKCEQKLCIKDGSLEVSKVKKHVIENEKEFLFLNPKYKEYMKIREEWSEDTYSFEGDDVENEIKILEKKLNILKNIKIISKGDLKDEDEIERLIENNKYSKLFQDFKTLKKNGILKKENEKNPFFDKKDEVVKKDFNLFKENQFNIKRLKSLLDQSEEYEKEDEENIKIELKENEKMLDQVKTYEIYKKINESFCSLKMKYDEKKKENYSIAHKIETLERLKNIVRKTINEYMTEKITYLNNVFNTILPKFFENLESEILLFNENKPEFNIEIYNKSIKQSFFDLSGGEKDRISVAFTLALNILTSSKILLFDESMKFFDKELKMEVLECLKEFSEDKIIINVCHDTIEGIHDHVINV
jgi:ABC-type lipoprotein export system ATPase subunit